MRLSNAHLPRASTNSLAKSAASVRRILFATWPLHIIKSDFLAYQDLRFTPPSFLRERERERERERAHVIVAAAHIVVRVSGALYVVCDCGRHFLFIHI